MKKTIALTFALLTSSIAYASQSVGPAFDFSKSAPVIVAQLLAQPATFYRTGQN